MHNQIPNRSRHTQKNCFLVNCLLFIIVPAAAFVANSAMCCPLAVKAQVMKYLLIRCNISKGRKLCYCSFFLSFNMLPLVNTVVLYFKTELTSHLWKSSFLISAPFVRTQCSFPMWRRLRFFALVYCCEARLYTFHAYLWLSLLNWPHDRAQF